MKHNVIRYNDPRQPGEALWQEWIGKEIYEGIRKESEVEFSALYQQTPVNASGNFFKQSTFKYYTETDRYITLGDTKLDKKDLRIYQTIDTAGTENRTSDFFACITFAIHSNNIIVLDTFKERAETTRHETIIEMLRTKWNPVYQAVEEKTFGLNIIQNAKLKGIPIYPLKADKSKIYRAEPLEVHLKNGLVWFKNGMGDLEKELLEFPNGKHDDLVDCLAYAVLLLLQSKNTLTIKDIYLDY